MWQNSKLTKFKTENLTKLKISNCEETKTQTQIVKKKFKKIVTKVKNSYCDKTQKLKLWNTSNQTVTKLKNSNYKIPKIEIVTKLKKLNYDKTKKYQIVTVFIMTVVTVVLMVTYFSKNNSIPQQPLQCSQGSFSRFSRCFIKERKTKYLYCKLGLEIFYLLKP